jgi:hypothetical protein
MAAQITGTIVVRMDGKSLRSKEKATLDVGGFERTSQYADHGYAGFSKKPQCAKVSATLVHTASTDVLEIADAEFVSIEFATDTGISYLIANAHCTKPPVLTGDGDGLQVEFEGEPAIQR